MKLGVCLCQLGIMSQCVAVDYGEQMSCDFFNRSDGSKKCMNLNPALNNHCWSQEAQDFSAIYGVVRFKDREIDDELETLYDESLEMGLGEENPRRNCKDCLMYTSCSKLIDLANAVAHTGGVTMQDLWNTASVCGSYLEETKIDISGGI